ncbi:1-phosphofructokinase family hexose kinase [Nocardia uniformis]|uniref:1-phosphofructokinase family hexose kinase n=2 Tax=Nocardia uniformis TaxID=53432 RepID=A0A849C0A2_9NOCA|nr:1-phosphofructokinase family hexose kinase [Nocardia uniformis]
MNPAVDLASRVERVVAIDKLRCAAPRFDPGGGGINAARTIDVLGEQVLAVFPAGGPAGLMLAEMVHAVGVPMRSVPVSGHTRQNLSVTETRSDDQYRFVFPGALLNAVDRERCLREIDRALTDSSYLVASGSLPPGVPADFYRTVVELARARGVRAIIDTSGAALRQIRGAYLIKPSLRELSELVGRPLPDRSEQVAAARQLIADGLGENVVVSLGSAGALAVTAETARRYPALTARVVSGIGAGDAMVGGITVGLARGGDLFAATCLGIAAATAALETPGTQPGRPRRIAELCRALGTAVCEKSPNALNS